MFFMGKTRLGNWDFLFFLIAEAFLYLCAQK